MKAWCHHCNGEVAAYFDDTNSEMVCSLCKSNFVEFDGQNIEEFLRQKVSFSNSAAVSSPSSLPSFASSASIASPSTVASGASIPGGENVLQQLVNRVLGLGVQTSGSGQQPSSLLNVLQQRAADSGGPVSVVVRQTVSAQDMQAISLGLSAGRGISTISANRASSAAISSESSRSYGRRLDREFDSAARSTLGLGLGTELGSSFEPIQGIGMPTASEGASQRQLPRISDLLSMLALGALSPSPTQFEGGMQGTQTQESLDSILHHILMHETSRAGEPGLSDAAIEALDRLQIDQHCDIEALGTCSISQEKFEVGDCAVTLPCGHIYKEPDIVHWLRMHGVCPTCRVCVVLPGFNGDIK